MNVLETPWEESDCGPVQLFDMVRLAVTMPSGPVAWRTWPVQSYPVCIAKLASNFRTCCGLKKPSPASRALRLREGPG